MTYIYLFMTSAGGLVFIHFLWLREVFLADCSPVNGSGSSNVRLVL